MAKISKNGLHEIQHYLKTSWEALADRLDKDGNLNSVQPQLEMIWKILNNIEQDWEKIDD